MVCALLRVDPRRMGKAVHGLLLRETIRILYMCPCANPFRTGTPEVGNEQGHYNRA